LWLKRVCLFYFVPYVCKNSERKPKYDFWCRIMLGFALGIEAFVEALFVLLHLCNTKKRLPKARPLVGNALNIFS
ncbi:hypothetical protein, partial [Seonamhaeicola marinus]|uniref:hypothetical protein n=1 Tax=Seonamhaeicola marinus TaxID=1912246 RepID=UPI001CA3405B